MLGWLGLRIELALWRRAGRRPRLWWRDDDARAVTPPLRRLLVEATRAGTPLSLAVIPDGLDPELGVALGPYAQVAVLQHGHRHRNEAGHPAAEFPPDLAPEAVAARLAEGWAALAGVPRRLPVYVPPWNTLTPNVEAALGASSYAAVSAWGGMGAAGRVDAHVDLLRWRPAPRFAGRRRVLGRLVRELKVRRRARRWDEPIGILTHHLAQDEAAWRFLRELLGFPPLEAAADWPPAAELFGCAD